MMYLYLHSPIRYVCDDSQDANLQVADLMQAKEAFRFLKVSEGSDGLVEREKERESGEREGGGREGGGRKRERAERESSL